MVSLDALRQEIKNLQSQERAKVSARFFKTGVGQYGEGDIFIGLTVPQSRVVATKYKTLSLSDVEKLLSSKIHEERLIALLILVSQFKKGDEKTQQEIYEFYLSHTAFINNWDLVDLSAAQIVGEYLWEHRGETPITRKQGVSPLMSLAHSQDLWEKRIAIISTYAYITKGDCDPTFYIADILLHDPHDLIQKAVGWMLREVGKRVSLEKEKEFLKTRYQTMPRTMLRYAIERFHEEKRKKYLVRETKDPLAF